MISFAKFLVLIKAKHALHAYLYIIAHILKGNTKFRNRYLIPFRYFFQQHPLVLTGYLSGTKISIRLDLSDWIQFQVYIFGCYEKNECIAFGDLLPPACTFMDIGANVGVYSLTISSKAKQVFSFEPSPIAFLKLQSTIRNNAIKNISVFQLAVDDKEDKYVSLYAPLPNNIGATSMHRNIGKPIAEVKTTTIDTFVNNSAIEKIDAIKIDIEGNELAALRGAKITIAKYRPLLFCEINEITCNAAGYSCKDLFNYITKELMYESYYLSEANVFVKVQSHELDLDNPSFQKNILFKPQR
jgi:FkbM family methyltransferase